MRDLLPALSYPAAVTVLLATCLSACGRSPVEQVVNYDLEYPPENGGTMIDATRGEPSGLITMIAGEAAASAVAQNIFSSLLRYDRNLEFEGELAESWQISPDQKVITFKLKPNLKWADGKPLTSADVLFTWKLITDDKTRTPYASDYKLVTKAETPDARTFRVSYAEPYAPAVNSWAGLDILPKHLLEGKDINNTPFARNPVGSHYYKLEKWRPGEQISLVSNPLSTQGIPRIERLVSRFIPDEASQFLELMANNIDTMALSPVQYARIFPARPELQKKFSLYKELGNSYTYLGFNLKRKPFNDVRVRKAINYAINKQELIDGVLLGMGEPVASPYKPGTRWSNPNLKPYSYDPSKARALLEEAGFKKNRNGILERNGKPLSFEILTNQNKQREMSAVLIQRRLKEIGIDVQIRVLEWASFIGRFIKTGDFDVVLLGWQLAVDPDQYAIWHSSQQAPGQFNFIGYKNQRVDRLLERGRMELNPDKRMSTYHEFAEILLEDSPIVYLFAGYGLQAMHKRIKGIDNPAPPAGIGHNSQDWYIPRPLRRTEISQ
ncbi:peptide-binding protein [Methylobacillus flagellatus]|uniref:peptide-binding protein n=1 Tax=Methylobacillus flagellatus TaxID=405 RepID=UPI002853AFDA|nr:peptide-binding protein [Methylobacillus flagellatus]MDR5171446.1 peptide-binding protein [Methylobacillus flagellatus]